MRFVPLPGHRFDTVGVAPLIDDISFDAMLADTAFDSNWIIEEMNARGALICPKVFLSAIGLAATVMFWL